MILNAYQPRNPDFELSPLTGMTRTHYIDLAKHMLERVFLHVTDAESPISFPLVDGKTYPQPDDPPWRHRSHEFEALERTFTIAAPLIHVEPDVEINGILLRDYYRRHFYRAFTPGHPNSIPMPDDLPDATYQFTCEFGGLFKTLLLMPHVVWGDYSRQEKDEMFPLISAWAHHRTTQNNWRIFNICALSFLKKEGYEINEGLLKDHLLWINSYHAGDGWYLEQTYNYYTISLFVVYMTIWNRTFGDEHYPEVAEAIEQTSRDLMRTYTNFFARDGSINMWARSICYRTWISGGFPVSFMLKEGYPIDPGFARRLCTGSLLQFVSREDFYVNGIPSLGFYRHSEFVVQNYSCPASPFLMFLPFIALALPADSPFWTARENEGFWDELGSRTRMEVLDHPGLILLNHGRTGSSEIIPGKVYYNDPNYGKLCYNTHFPWEDRNPAGGSAMEYSFRSLDPRDLRGEDVNFYLTGISVDNSTDSNQVFDGAESILYNGIRDGVVYRQGIMRRPPNNGVGYIIDLAEFPLEGGIVRVDRSRLAFEHELTLGHFGLPNRDDGPPEIERFKNDLCQGITATIAGRRVALLVYRGWDHVESLEHSGRSIEADSSTVLYARKKRITRNPAMELMIVAMLHRTDDRSWTPEELSPIRQIREFDIMPSGSAMGAVLTLADGSERVVDFQGIDGFKNC